jgi:hypothetical protein
MTRQCFCFAVVNKVALVTSLSGELSTSTKIVYVGEISTGHFPKKSKEKSTWSRAESESIKLVMLPECSLIYYLRSSCYSTLPPNLNDFHPINLNPELLPAKSN